MFVIRLINLDVADGRLDDGSASPPTAFRLVLDNVLKPFLLGHGLDIPIIVILIEVIGCRLPRRVNCHLAALLPATLLPSYRATPRPF
jgi:hypothetical protein